MKTLILLEYYANLIILLVFYMHMFQLNSYIHKNHFHWMKLNITKILIKSLLILIPGILLYLNNKVFTILAILVLFISIIYNIPKKKSKISLKITSRVCRMFFTELLIITILTIISYKCNFLLLMTLILNICTPILCIICNFINYPFEILIKKVYINQAKKILKSMPDLTVIGITGSYGKTSVKNYLVKTLSAKYEVLTTPKNYNTPMGVVKTIRESLKPTHKYFICEMGAYKLGEIKEICDIVNPKIGIITAIGPQHLQSFKSIDNIIKTKFELFDAVNKNNGVTFLNYSNDYIKANKVDGKIFKYGIEDKNLDFYSYNLKSSKEGLSFSFFDKTSNEEIEFNTKLIGKHNALNLTVAIAVASYLGVPCKSMVSRIRSLKNVEHRLELISRGNITIIDDSYNSNPVSSKSALDTLSEFDDIKIAVTPGLIELGSDEKKYNFELGTYMTNTCDYIFIVNSKSSKYILDGIYSTNYKKDKVFTVNSPQEAVEKISKLFLNKKVTILLENDLPDNYNV